MYTYIYVYTAYTDAMYLRVHTYIKIPYAYMSVKWNKFTLWC